MSILYKQRFRYFISVHIRRSLCPSSLLWTPAGDVWKCHLVFVFASSSLFLSLSQPLPLRLELNWDGRVLRCPRTPWCPTPCLMQMSFLITMSLVGLKRVERSVGSSAVRRPERRYFPSISPGKRWCPCAVFQFVSWTCVVTTYIKHIMCHVICDTWPLLNVMTNVPCFFERPGSITGFHGLKMSHRGLWRTKILFYVCCCSMIWQVLHGSHPGPSDIRLYL